MMDKECLFSFWAPAVLEFCEAAVYCFPRYPVDTVTNLGPLIAGLVMLRLANRQPAFLWLGGSAILTAFFSAFYHGSGTLVGEYLDLFGMHIFISGCLTVTILRQKNEILGRQFLLIASGLSLLLMAISLASIHLASPAFAAVCLVVIGLEIKSKDNLAEKKHLWRAVITLLVAYIFWLLDFLHILCDPDNHLMTGHGIWHLLCGYVFYSVFMYYRKSIDSTPL